MSLMYAFDRKIISVSIDNQNLLTEPILTRVEPFVKVISQNTCDYKNIIFDMISAANVIL